MFMKCFLQNWELLKTNRVGDLFNETGLNSPVPVKVPLVRAVQRVEQHLGH